MERGRICKGYGEYPRISAPRGQMKGAAGDAVCHIGGLWLSAPSTGHQLSYGKNI